MGRIADARGDEALSVAAELVGILSELSSDEALLGALRDGMTAGALLSLLFREHGGAVLRLIALDEGMSEAEARTVISPLSLPGRALALFGDEAVRGLFGSAAAENAGRGSSAASGNGSGSPRCPSLSGD